MQIKFIARLTVNIAALHMQVYDVSTYRVARNFYRVLMFATFAIFLAIRKNKFPQIKITANSFPAKSCSRANIV